MNHLDNKSPTRHVGQPAPFPLSPRAQRWLGQLQGEVQLEILCRECPEVLDRLASHWHDPDALGQTFDGLLFGSGNERPRTNLSFQALLEVASLRHYAAFELKRWRLSAWDEALDFT